MARTFTNSLRFTMQAPGDNVNTWGNVVNQEDFMLMDTAIAGVVSVDISTFNLGPNIYVLSALDGLPDQARNMVLVLTGTLTQDMVVRIPSVTKFYLVANKTTGAFTTTIQPNLATLPAVVIPQGSNRLIYCDGTNAFPGDPVGSDASYGTNAAPSYAVVEDGSTGYNILDPSTLSPPSATGVLTMAVSGAEALRVTNIGTGFGRDTINSRINITGRVEATPIPLTSGATVNWDLSLGNIFTLTLGTNATLANPTNMVAGTYYALSVTQDATGNRTLSYGSAYQWGRAGVPVLTGISLTTDLMLFYCNGTQMLGTINYGYSA
jgi:hypothetical protein